MPVSASGSALGEGVWCDNHRVSGSPRGGHIGLWRDVNPADPDILGAIAPFWAYCSDDGC